MNFLKTYVFTPLNLFDLRSGYKLHKKIFTVLERWFIFGKSKQYKAILRINRKFSSRRFLISDISISREKTYESPAFFAFFDGFVCL